MDKLTTIGSAASKLLDVRFIEYVIPIFDSVLTYSVGRINMGHSIHDYLNEFLVYSLGKKGVGTKLPGGDEQVHIIVGTRENIIKLLIDAYTIESVNEPPIDYAMTYFDRKAKVYG